MLENQTTAKPIDILRESLVYQRERIILAMETYLQGKERKTYFINAIKPKIQTLYLFIKPEFDKQNPEEDPKELFRTGDVESILSFYYLMDEWLNDKKLITLTNEKRL